MVVKYLGFVLKEGQQAINTERVKVIIEILWPLKKNPNKTQPAMRILRCSQVFPTVATRIRGMNVISDRNNKKMK